MGAPAIPPNLTEEELLGLRIELVEIAPGVEADAVCVLADGRVVLSGGRRIPLEEYRKELGYDIQTGVAGDSKAF